MKIRKEEALTLQELLYWLEKRKGGQKWWATSDQRDLATYAEQYSKLSEERSKKFLRMLTEDVGLPREIAVQIVRIIPLVIDEVDPFIQQLKEDREWTREELQEKTKQILQATREVWKEKSSP
ncbi:MAG: hypothetical protein GWO20_08715 [Candidatus Korarchaeota archaeon]|nr:hypothetical protein [Candidatus Korarchaeota archaeon]NIU83466.1 hypothetical protein [Candidatus Thorarchaeota archaeon]NIW13742.1 hypothetical protein [Candidatus Thorarchaeota archaeon]NIW51837.1 hypothetical protein [Candidatus Korarchaeota archaeon]